MDKAAVDVLIMPTASYPPKLNGDRNTTPTGTTTWIASSLHWPALVVPMGYTGEDLPSGLQFLGRLWSAGINKVRGVMNITVHTDKTYIIHRGRIIIVDPKKTYTVTGDEVRIT